MCCLFVRGHIGKVGRPNVLREGGRKYERLELCVRSVSLRSSFRVGQAYSQGTAAVNM
jgi:hypothetical protein